MTRAAHFPPLSADVLGLGCVLPGAPDCAHFAAVLAGQAPLPTAQRHALPGGMTTGVFRHDHGTGTDPAHAEAAFAAALATLDLPEAVAQRALRIGRRGSATLRATLLAAAQAWMDAGQPSGDTVGVVLAGNNLDPGAGHAAARDFDTEGLVSPFYGIAWLDGHLIGAISEVFGLTGPGVQVGGSSAAGLMGVMQAALMVRAGMAATLLVVAPPMILSDVELGAFMALQALAVMPADQAWPRYLCRPFDQSTTGFVPGESAAAVVLGQAQAARFRITGGATVMDGHARAAPNAAGEARAMRGALTSAGLVPDQIDYINAHGSGSPRGDLTEAEAIAMIFATVRPPINATKALVGHGLTSAGLVEVVATCLQMQSGLLHGNPGLTVPISDTLDLIGPDLRHARVRHALCNNFAFGGINAAAVITDTQKEDA